MPIDSHAGMSIHVIKRRPRPVLRRHVAIPRGLRVLRAAASAGNPSDGVLKKRFDVKIQVPVGA